MIKGYFFIPILLICFSHISAQIKITGIVLQSNNEALENASITLSAKNKTQISAFATTNSKGFFELVSNEVGDSITVKVALIGYKTQQLIIANKAQVLKFTLVEFATELATLIAKEKPITQSGDTTNYLVKSFANKQDRMIGDVIARLPGIEIDENNGQIKFNGKAISHYYIDGLDLLEKKYNIANRNIPADLVEQVQILENHQDIRLFDSITKGTEPALNITLKAKAKNKLIVKAKLALGLPPVLWDNELIGLQFNPLFQLLTSYKNNNAGAVLANEISENYTIKKIGDNDAQNSKEEVLSKLSTQQPPVNTRRYLFNNTHLFHFNTLKVLPNKSQLKYNLSYLNDNNILENVTQSIFTLPTGQSINFIESRTHFVNTNKIDGNIIYTKNTKKLYIKNLTKIKLDFSKEYSNIENPLSVVQLLQNPIYDYANIFLAHLPVKKKIISVNSVTSFNKAPQVLSIMPGQFTDIFNQSIAYDRIAQSAQINNFHTNNNLSFFSKFGKFNQLIKFGSAFSHKKLISNISKLYNQNEYILADSFKNRIGWNNVRLYAENEISILKTNKQLFITLPIEINILNTQDDVKKRVTNTRNIFFNPTVDVNFTLSTNLTAGIAYSLQNTIGNITNITSGLILNNYRNIYRNDSLVPKQQQQNLTATLFYKNAVKAMFSNLSISAAQTKKNILFSQIFDGLFINSVGSFRNNYQKSIIISGNASKYILKSKTNLALNYNYGILQADLLQQNKIVKSNSTILSVGIKSNLNMLSFISIESNTKYNFFKNKLKQAVPIVEGASTVGIQQNLRLSFNQSKNFNMFLTNEWYGIYDNRGNKGTYYFADIGCKQKFTKLIVELELTNFTNSKNYVSISNAENLQQINSFKIRPAFVMAKFYFNL